MANQVTVLSVTSAIGGEFNVSVVFWYPVTAGQECPNPGATSAYKNAPGAVLTALQAGQLIEESRSYIVPSSYSIAQVEAFLLAMYQAKATYIGTKPAVGQFYGFNYDGTSWNAVHG